MEWFLNLFDAISRWLQGLFGHKGNLLTIFSHDLTLETPIKRFGHERPFVDLIEVDELYYHVAKNLTETEMMRCVSALLSSVQPALTLEGAIQLFVFTTDEDDSPTTISLDKTHAFSILTSRGDLQEHHYFEKQNTSVFQKIPSLSMAISSPLDLDDIRLLHFAGIDKHNLPPKSTIYEFISAQAFRSEGWSIKKDHSVRISLLLDQNRNLGAPTIGIRGDEIYLAFLNTTGTYCGGNRDCPEGSSSTCGNAPGGPDKVCGSVENGGDIFVDVSQVFKAHEIVPPVPIDFGLLRFLRKNFLSSYRRGKDYTAYYYIAALFAKYDQTLLERYVHVMPHIDKAMKDLLSDSEDKVIVTTPLRDMMLEIIENHRDVENRQFQDILDIVAKDLRTFHGMTKSQLIDALSQQPSML